MPATIKLYGVIGDWWEGLDAATVVRAIEAVPAEEELHVRINSNGGFVAEGLPIYNTLKQRPGRVVVHIDGLAASMASAIAMAGDEVIAPVNAIVMIHDPETTASGNAAWMRKTAGWLDIVGGSLLSIYRDKTGIAEDELRAMLAAETYMGAAEAAERGFVDTVLSGDAAPTAATVNAAIETAVAQLNTFLSRPNLRDAAIGRACAPEIDRLAAMATRIPAARAAAAIRPAPPAPPNEETEMSGTDTSAAITQADVQAAATAAVTAERARVDEIQGAVRAAKLPAILGEADCATFTAKLLKDGVTADDARKQIIDKLAASTGGIEIHNQVRIQVGQDARDKFRAGASLAIQARAGMIKDDATNEFRGLTLRELARDSLHRAGVGTTALSPLDMIGMAFTYGHGTGDFPYILEATARKAMLKGWEENDETFRVWTGTGTLTDFKIHSRVDLGLAPNLAVVPEGAEYKYITISDRKETAQLATYGRLFAITRQAIINDDLGAFTRIPQRMGRAAIRTIGNLVYYNIINANPTMGDGTALFEATTHKNYTASGTAPTAAAVSAGRALMAKQVDPDAIADGGLNIRPKYMLVPPEIEDTARVLAASEFDPSKTQRTPNPVRGTFEVVSEARLSNTSQSGSTTAWYLAADPMMHDTVEVLYLDGQQQPFLEQKDGWSIDGTEFKVRIDAAAKVWDHRPLYKNSGTGGG